MLLRLAEHLAIRFALDRYERGEVRVNAVRQMLDRMSQEIEGLREILGSHEEKMASAGLVVESHLDVLDRQFWAAVPDSGKRAVLTSPDAWCIPPRNLRQYVEELRRKGDEATATAILENYASAIKNADATARRRVAIGLPELADLYAASEQLLGSTIRDAGVQLAIEREDDLQGLDQRGVRALDARGGQQAFPWQLCCKRSIPWKESKISGRRLRRACVRGWASRSASPNSWRKRCDPVPLPKVFSIC